MNPPIERRRWAIGEGYVPGRSNGSEPQFTSHESAYLLNASDEDAHLEITMFSDRELVEPYRLTVSARRTCSVRFNELEDPERIPKDTDYASVESDVPIVVQHPSHLARFAPGRERAALHHSVREQRVGRFRCPT
jgi:hypothetical protein